MHIVEKRLDEIKPYEKNPRVNDKAVEKVAESIKTYGFQQPIVVDKNGVIIVGHTRYKASQQLKLETVPVVVADCLSEKEVKAYRIADNKVADYSIWDNKLLLEELEGLDDIFTGFTESDYFDDTLDNTTFTALEENEYGVEYEIKFRTGNKEKADRIMDEWRTIDA